MPPLYRAADCFVLPSRAEGRGRALLEAQACGLPAIAPGSVAARGLLPPDSPWQIECGDGAGSPAGWVEPDVADLRAKLRAAFADPTATRSFGADAAWFVRERFRAGAASAVGTSFPARRGLRIQPHTDQAGSLPADNPYTDMQRGYYERTADLMNETNHSVHNGNRDYWDILVADTLTGFRDKVGLDFGCGCGRNIMNVWNRFRRMDGVDLGAGNIAHARRNLL